MGELGLLGGPLPSEFGGGDWDNLSLVVAYEEIGKVDSSVRGLMTVHTSLVSQCILRWGSEDQLRTILPRLASGRLIGCYCLTEPRAGSDAASLETTVKPDGKDFVLSGEKTWITNGGIADLAIVFATKKPGGGREHISAFLIQTDNPGFHRESMPGVELGHRASDHAHIRLESCRVPGSSLLGKVGEGFKVAMSALDQGRLGVAAGAVGVAQACLDASLEFARQRRQFGRRIGDFGMIQATLADMAADVEAARMLVYRAAWLKDKGHDARRETSIAKLFATEAAVRAANEAVLVHGSRGWLLQRIPSRAFLTRH